MKLTRPILLSPLGRGGSRPFFFGSSALSVEEFMTTTTSTITLSDDDLISLPKAAETIGIPRSSAYLLVLRGDLPARLIAGRYVVKRSDAIDYMRLNLKKMRRRVSPRV